MQEIPLTKGKVALVDDEDYEELMRYKWQAHERTPSLWYANRTLYPEKKELKMHRFILKAPITKEVDHIDGNGLNNQKANLRLCTHRENQQNRRPTGQTSQYKGVSFHKDSGKWRARIQAGGQAVFLGGFTEELEAAIAYDKAAQELFGEFAHLNFPQGRA